jgi:transcriptional regulator
MYIPKSFEQNDMEGLHEFIKRYSFATLITHHHHEPKISHIPILLKRDQGPFGTLAGHVAKLNPHAELFDGNQQTLCIFHGPHAYISANWYLTSPNVPTWNYAVVHAYGKPKLISTEELSDDLSVMLNHYEGLLDENSLEEKSHFQIEQDYKLQLMKYIVGFKMEITRIEGKFKLGQNRSREDQESMLRNLKKQGTDEEIALVNFIETWKGR